jgi:hypothetical protein
MALDMRAAEMRLKLTDDATEIVAPVVLVPVDHLCVLGVLCGYHNKPVSGVPAILGNRTLSPRTLENRRNLRLDGCNQITQARSSW